MADTSLRITAETVPDLFAAAGWGLTWLILDPDEVSETIHRTICVVSDTVDALLIEWLNELLYRFEVHHEVFHRFEVSLDGLSLTADIHGAVIDRDTAVFRNDVKAVTWHGLAVRRSRVGFTVQVIFDL